MVGKFKITRDTNIISRFGTVKSLRQFVKKSFTKKAITDFLDEENKVELEEEFLKYEKDWWFVIMFNNLDEFSIATENELEKNEDDYKITRLCDFKQEEKKVKFSKNFILKKSYQLHSLLSVVHSKIDIVISWDFIKFTTGPDEKNKVVFEMSFKEDSVTSYWILNWVEVWVKTLSCDWMIEDLRQTNKIYEMVTWIKDWGSDLGDIFKKVFN